MDKTTAIVVGTMSVVLMLVLGAVGIAVITNDDDSAPAPVTSSTPAPSDTSDPLLDILEETWNSQSPNEQELLCTYYKYDPERAYDSFNEGADGLLPEETFV